MPLLDMRRYHQLLAGASWVAEFGDPDDPAEWAFIKKYSPYQNVDRRTAVTHLCSSPPRRAMTGCTLAMHAR